MFKLFPKYIECCTKCPFSYERTQGFIKDIHCKLIEKALPETYGELLYVTSDLCPLEDADLKDE